jgi:NADH-ubiquinone oxidoreductase chain 2
MLTSIYPFGLIDTRLNNTVETSQTAAEQVELKEETRSNTLKTSQIATEQVKLGVTEYPRVLLEDQEEIDLVRKNQEEIDLQSKDQAWADSKKNSIPSGIELDEEGIIGKGNDVNQSMSPKIPLNNAKELLQATREHYNLLEYSLVIQFIIIGSISLLSCNDLITMFLGIELQSYGLYILSSIYRNSESSTSAGLTYFLLGGLSSCIILLGQSFLYINSGLTNLDGLYLLQNIITSDKFILEFFYSDLTSEFITSQNYSYLSFQNYALQLSFIILSVGFLFKISAAPFHSWSPGVYNSVPTVTTTFIAILPKISIFILFFDLVYSTWFCSDMSQKEYSWTTILLLSSFLSLIIGSILGLSQNKIKKLYAYSTISHVGFLLLALGIHNIESIQAFIFYLIQYSLSNFNAFIILITIGYTYAYYHKNTKNDLTLQSMADYKKELENLSPVEYIDRLKGFFYINPFLSLSLAITLYSFIGIPPLVGFFAKQMVLSSALDNGYIFISLVAILTSVISAVYYLYIVKHMFFEKSVYKLSNSFTNYFDNSKTNNSNTQIGVSSSLSMLISLLTLIILSFIFIYNELYNLISIISIFISY